MCPCDLCILGWKSAAAQINMNLNLLPINPQGKFLCTCTYSYLYVHIVLQEELTKLLHAYSHAHAPVIHSHFYILYCMMSLLHVASSHAN